MGAAMDVDVDALNQIALSNYGLSKNTSEELVVWDSQLCCMAMPIVIQTLLNFGMRLKVMESTVLLVYIMPRDSCLVEVGKSAGKAYGETAATMRLAHQQKPKENLAPEHAMGPAFVQVFLESMEVLLEEKNTAGLGTRNQQKIETMKAKWDNRSLPELLQLVKAWRVSDAWADGNSKIIFSVNDADLETWLCDVMYTLGGERKSGIAPRSRNERVLQLLADYGKGGGSGKSLSQLKG